MPNPRWLISFKTLKFVCHPGTSGQGSGCTSEYLLNSAPKTTELFNYVSTIGWDIVQDDITINLFQTQHTYRLPNFFILPQVTIVVNNPQKVIHIE